MAVTKRAFRLKGAKRLPAEIEGVTQIFDFAGVLSRPQGGKVPGAWRMVGKAMQSAIETYDPSVKFEPAHLVGRCTATEVRKLKVGGAFERRRVDGKAGRGVPVKITMVVTNPKGSAADE